MFHATLGLHSSSAERSIHLAAILLERKPQARKPNTNINFLSFNARPVMAAFFFVLMWGLSAATQKFCSTVGALSRNDAIGSGNYWKSGENAEALDHIRQAIVLFEQLMTEDPKDARIRRSSAYGYRDLGEALAANGERVEAEKSFNTALGIFEEMGVKDPRNGVLISQQALTHLKMSRFFLSGPDMTRALNSTQRAVKIGESIILANPLDVNARKTLAESAAQLGKCFEFMAGASGLAKEEEQGTKWQEARTWYVKSASLWREVADKGRLSTVETKKQDEVAAAIVRADNALPGK